MKPSSSKRSWRPPSYNEKESDMEHGPPNPGSTSEHHSLPVEDYSQFWDQYVKESEAYDKEMVNGMTGDLDTLLIFAGLFSGINTAFIIDTYRDLRPDPMQGTNLLLKNIINTLNNSTSTQADPVFLVSTQAVRINALFFASLSCSLFAAFGAVLGKQWLNEYERAGHQRSSFHRGMRRHAKYHGLEKYQLELVIQSLPALLQISLFLFLIALSDFLLSLNQTVGGVVLACLALMLLFYFITTIISLCDSSSPFSTRFSSMFRDFFHQSKTGFEYGSVQAGECVAWLRDRATSFTSVSAMAKAAILLPPDIRAPLELDVGNIVPTLFRAIISNNIIQAGIVAGTLSTTLNILHDVVAGWRPPAISPLTDAMVDQLYSTLRIVVSSDALSSELIIKILEKLSIGGKRIDVDHSILDSIVQNSSLDHDGKSAVLTLLWSSIRDIEPWRQHQWVKSKPPAYLNAPRLLESTMWIDQARTLTDHDEERLKFRMWWLQQPSNDFSYIRSFSKYFGQWNQAHPSLGRTSMEGTEALLKASKRVWFSYMKWYGWVKCRCWVFQEPAGTPCVVQDLHTDGNIDRVMQMLVSRNESSDINLLLPCFWTHHLSTQHDMPASSFVRPDYFHLLVSFLSTKAHTEENVGGMFMPESTSEETLGVWMLESLCFYLEASKNFIQPDMIDVLKGIDAITQAILEKKSPDDADRERMRILRKGIQELFHETTMEQTLR